jgi:hypothetical protein
MKALDVRCYGYLNPNIHRLKIFSFSFNYVRWRTTESTNTPAITWLIFLAPDDEYTTVGGMRIDRVTEVLGAPVPLCPPQIPYDLTWDRPREAGD